MLTHEIRPAQLRALLLLLALVPLVPTMLLLRFTQDVEQSERAVARQQAEDLYRQFLVSSERHLSRNLATPADVHRFYSDLLGSDLSVRVTDSHGKLLAGVAVPPGRPLAKMSLRKLGRPWEVELFGQLAAEPAMPAIRCCSTSRPARPPARS